MRFIKKIFKVFLYILLIPVSYILIALVLSYIPIDRENNEQTADQTIYLSTNGVHLDIVIPVHSLDNKLLQGLKFNHSDQYMAFGWGDENFYVNTPTWGDLTFNNAFGALFLKSTTLMHVTQYKSRRTNWVTIKLSKKELNALNNYISNQFKSTHDGGKMKLDHPGYGSNDAFYKANGSYSCFKTCNSWVNSGFKESGLKSCLWTPFDFGLLNQYE